MTNFKNCFLAGLGLLLASGAVSCKNSDTDFPDYEGGVSAFFAYQYPARQVVLGEWPDGDNTLDNNHEIMIFATQGGAYKPRDLKINVMVDPSLVNNLTFADGSPVQVMPESYYTLESTTFTKQKGFNEYLFGSKVKLNDAFFADPASIKNTYVIPVRIVDAIGADRVISGTPAVEGAAPDRCDASAWSVLPQDYVLYCVRYSNPWDASYLRRGVDQVTDAVNGTYTVVRHEQYVEKDEVVRLSTRSMSEVVFPLSTVMPDGESVKTVTCDMILKFNGDDCTISTSTPGMTASGTGKFVKLGEKNSWNHADHDAIYLDYQVDFGGRKFNTKDTLVVRSREVVPENDFKPVYTK